MHRVRNIIFYYLPGYLIRKMKILNVKTTFSIFLIFIIGVAPLKIVKKKPILPYAILNLNAVVFHFYDFYR